MKEKQLVHTEVTRSGEHFPLVIVCEDMLDPLNVGSVFRLADAMGVAKIYLTGMSVAPPHRKITKTARSTEKVVPYAKVEDKALVISELTAESYTLIGLEITSKSESIFDFSFGEFDKIALWMGSENAGISEPVLAELAHCVHIPMRGTNSSMNVVQALGMGVFEVVRQEVGKWKVGKS